ncbi:MAG: MobA-like NTP transferase domain containing protein, partial [Nitrospirae bacterium]
MKGYDGNKTLLPLIPKKGIFEGERPMLIEVLEKLPLGDKAIVVNYKKEDVISATKDMNVVYCYQKVRNGTGGALIAAEDFIKHTLHDAVIVTMGDVPLIRSSTYERLLYSLSS